MEFITDIAESVLPQAVLASGWWHLGLFAALVLPVLCLLMFWQVRRQGAARVFKIYGIIATVLLGFHLMNREPTVDYPQRDAAKSLVADASASSGELGSYLGKGAGWKSSESDLDRVARRLEKKSTYTFRETSVAASDNGARASLIICLRFNLTLQHTAWLVGAVILCLCFDPSQA